MSALPEGIINLREKLESEASKTNAWKIIIEYLKFFHVEGVQNDLWLMLVGALTSDETDRLETGRQKHDLIFFYEYTLMFVDAVAVLKEKRDQKGKG